MKYLDMFVLMLVFVAFKNNASGIVFFGIIACALIYAAARVFLLRKNK